MMPDSIAQEMDPVLPRPGMTTRTGARIRRLQDLLARRPFLKNVSIMLTGAAGGQLVSLLLSPILTRLYTPQQFGILSIYSAILAISVVVASMRYELALTLVQSDEEAINLTAVCIFALLLTTAAVCLATYGFPEHLLERIWPVPLSWEHVAAYRGVLVLGYLCLGGYFIALYLATYAGAYHWIAKTRLGQGIVGPSSQICLALLGTGAPGLLIGSILGQSAGTFGLFYNVIAERHRTALQSLSWRRMAELARRYCRFPLVSSWAALIDAIGGAQLLYLLISVFYSARIAGFVFLAERVVSRPLAIVGTSVLQVFIGEAGQTVATNPAKLKRRFYQVVTRQFGLAAAWVAIANVIGALTFSTVFGAEWNAGIIYLQAMSLAYLAQAIVQPVFHTLQILERQALAAAWQIGRLILTGTAFLTSAGLGLNAPWVIAIYGAAQAASCGILLLLMARAIQQLQR